MESAEPLELLTERQGTAALKWIYSIYLHWSPLSSVLFCGLWWRNNIATNMKVMYGGKWWFSHVAPLKVIHRKCPLSQGDFFMIYTIAVSAYCRTPPSYHTLDLLQHARHRPLSDVILCVTNWLPEQFLIMLWACCLSLGFPEDILLTSGSHIPCFDV